MTNPTTPLLSAEPISAERMKAAILKLKDLPAAAPVVHKALVQLEDPDFAVAELKKVLLSDQAVAARILRLANSAYFGFRSEVQTVSQAVVLLGQSRIRTLLHRLLVDRLLTELGHGESAGIRRRSLATATASALLSQLLVVQDAEEMLLAGLLHNIGELFCYARFPAHYEQVREGQDPRALFPLSWWQAGKLLLESWQFPPLYPTVVEYCEDPLSPSCPEPHQTAVRLVHAGKKLAEGFIGGKQPAGILAGIAEPIRELCHLDEDLISEVFATLPQRMSLEQLQAGRR